MSATAILVQALSIGGELANLYVQGKIEEAEFRRRARELVQPLSRLENEWVERQKDKE